MKTLIFVTLDILLLLLHFQVIFILIKCIHFFVDVYKKLLCLYEFALVFLNVIFHNLELAERRIDGVFQVVDDHVQKQFVLTH